MKEIKTDDKIRLNIVITEDLQHAAARMFGLAIVELTREYYCSFILKAIRGEIAFLKVETEGWNR